MDDKDKSTWIMAYMNMDEGKQSDMDKDRHGDMGKDRHGDMDKDRHGCMGKDRHADNCQSSLKSYLLLI